VTPASKACSQLEVLVPAASKAAPGLGYFSMVKKPGIESNEMSKFKDICSYYFNFLNNCSPLPEGRGWRLRENSVPERISVRTLVNHKF